MREFKFRAYDKKDNEMFYSSMYQDKTSMAYGLGNFLSECGDIEDTLMQYTGLKDKNGIDVYEGDVVKTKNSLYKVIYDKCCFWGIDEMGKYPIYQTKHYVMEDEIFEVIGNIYENPELLKVTQ